MQKVLFASVVLAALPGAWADLCPNGQGLTQDTKSNDYCKPVQALSFDNVQGSGSYNRVTSMNINNGQCGQTPTDYSGSLGPLSDEVSVHLRGPIKLSRFAAYQGAAPYRHKHKRGTSKHLHMHRQHMKAKRAAPLDKRGCGDWVTATYPANGDIFSFQWTEGCGAPAAPTQAPTAAPAPAAPAVVAAAATSTPAPPTSGSAAGVIGGSWARTGYYNGASQEQSGVSFLNNMGNSALSGGWTAAMGNSLSYASADGCAAAANSTTLAADTLIPSVAELVIMSDKQCGGDGDDAAGDCGFYRPDGVAHHGFGGDQKAFVWEFQMPDVPADNSKWSGNMPAIWLLNAQIPRTAQYGSTQCKAWPGAGELDVAEALDEGETRLKATIHGNAGFNAGNNDYFQRPTGGNMILGLVMMDSKVIIKVLPSFDFAAGSGAAAVSQITQGTQTQGGDISIASLY